MVLPAEALSSDEVVRHRGRLGSEVSLLSWESSETIACCEVGDLPLVNVALQVIDARRDFQEYAERVHTRNDIPWQALACAPPTVEHSDTFTSTMVME